MKRFLASLTLLSFLFIPMAQAADATESDWYWSDYYYELQWMSDNGVMKPNSEGNLRPSECANRAEFLKMLYTMKGGVEESRTSFPDVPHDAWFAPYVAAAVEDGAVSGYSDGTFKPGLCVTRAEAIKMTMMSFESELPLQSGDADIYMEWYSDVQEQDWYYDNVTWALDLKVAGESHASWGENFENGYFYPNDFMPREEVAALLYRVQAVVDNDVDYYDYWVEPYPLGELFVESCSINKSDVANGVPLEWGMSADAAGFVKVDGTNKGQLKQLASHIESLGDGSAWTTLIDAYDSEVSDELSYESLVEEVIMDDWQIGFTYEASTDGTPAYTVAVSVDEYNKFQKWMATQLWKEHGANLKCEAHGTYTLWTSENAELYGFRYGDLFTFSNTEEQREKIMDQVFAEEGLSPIAVDALVYGWMDMSQNSDLFALQGIELSADMMDYEEMEFTLKTDEGGLHMISDVRFASDDNEVLSAYDDASLELSSRVPDTGELMFYMEDQDLSLVLAAVLMSFTTNEDAYELLSESTGFESETLQALAESGYAMSISNGDDVVPNLAFYLHLEEDEEQELAASLTEELDLWLESVASETKYTLDDTIDIDYLVQDETVSGEVRKWDIVNDSLETDAQDVLGEETLELYYGLVEEDVYVIALYEDFLGAWTEDPISENYAMQQSAKAIGHRNPALVQYIDLEIISDWLSLVSTSSAPAEMESGFESVLTWLETAGSIYSSGYVTHDKVLRQELYWSL